MANKTIINIGSERTQAEDIEKIVVELGKKGVLPAQIGLILKRGHNVGKGMKTKISISLDEGTLVQLEELMQCAPEYRSKSHLIEMAIRKQLAEKQEAGNGA